MKKHIKWILPVLAAVLLLAGLGIAWAAGLFAGDVADAPADTEMKIYWNVDREMYVDGTKTRAAKNGKYFAPMAVDGEQVDMFFDNVALLQEADELDMMGLIVNELGYVVDVLDIKEFTGGLAVRQFFITEMTEHAIKCNALQNLSGFEMTVYYDENTKVYDVSGEGPLAGIPGQLAVGKCITGVQDERGVMTHVWISAAFEASPIYWNLERLYDSNMKRTTRERNVHGEFVYQFAVEGKQVELATRDPEVADTIDSYTNKCVHLEFDEDGLIVKASSVKNAAGGNTAASGYYVTEINPTNATFTSFSASTMGKTSTQRLAPGYKVFNMSDAADYKGQPDQLQLFDQVRCVKDATGDVATIFIINRWIDGEIYWNLERLYDKETASTTRTPDAYGYYRFNMLLDGKNVTLRTNDKAIASYIDSRTTKTVSLTVEGDIITGAYVPSKVEGGVSFASSSTIKGISADGTVTAYRASDDPKAQTHFYAQMTENTKVYNVSSEAGVKGEVTTLRIGDTIQGYTDLYGNLTIVFVTKRTSDSPMYWNVDKDLYWDSVKKETKRTPDENGYYCFTMAVEGKQIVVKTADKKIADDVDNRGIMGLKLSGNTILRVFSATATVNTKGGLVASGYYVTSVDGGKITATKISGTNKGEVVTMPMSWNCKIYDVSKTAELIGQKGTVQVGDQIRCLLNEAKQIDTMYVLNKNLHTEDHVCDCCGTTPLWVTWDGKSTMVDGVHYCIGSDVALPKYFPMAANATITICLNGKTVTAANNRVFPTIKGGSVVNVVDHTDKGVLHGKQNRNGAVAAVDGGTLNIYGGTMTADEITAKDMNGGVLVVVGGGKINLYGGNVTGGKTTGSCGNINVSNGTLTIAGGTVSNGVSGTYGGNIGLTSANAKMIITGGTITGGKSTTYGGNIAIVATKATAEISGGTISNGVATTHGGNLGYALGTVTMTGGTITGGKATTYGGNISVPGTAVFNITGGSVTNGEIMYRADSVISVGGTAQISQLHLVEGKLITLSDTALTTGAKIGISMNRAGVFAEDVTKDVSGFFYGYDNNYEAVYENKTLVLEKKDKHVHCWCGGAELENHTCEDDAKWQPLTIGMRLEDGGHYYLTEEFTDRLMVNENATVYLCLNGVSYSRSASRVFNTLDAGMTVNICDCSVAQTGTLHGAYDNNAGVAMVDGGTLNIFGGNFSAEANTGAAKNGGVLMAMGNGQINIYNGTVSGGNTTGNGGNIYITGNAGFAMYGGTVTGGTAQGLGGGVYCATTGNVVLGGSCQITGNNGSNLYLVDTTKVTLDPNMPLDTDDTDGTVAKVGITRSSDGVAVEGITTAQVSCFTSDNDAILSFENGTLSTVMPHKHCWCEGADAVPAGHTCDADMIWQPIAKSAGGNAVLENGKAYYLDWSDKSAQRVTVADGATAYLDLNGAQMRAMDAITLGAGSKLYICDCVGTGLIASTGNTPVQIADGNEVVLMSGKITGVFGTQASRISVKLTGGSFTMYGGAVVDGCSTSSEVPYENKIDRNPNGANIQALGGNVAIYGGAVTGGVTTGNGKDIYIGGTATIAVGGKAVIGDLYLATGKTLSITELDTTASIGISVQDATQPFATGLSVDYTNNFVPTITDSVVTYDAGNLFVVLPVVAHTHCWCVGAEATIAGHTCTADQVWTGISSSYVISTDGYYFLDFAQSGKAMSVEVAEGVNAYLCLNGKKIYARNTIKLNANASLTVCDCSTEKTGTIGASADPNAGSPVVIDGSNKAFTLVSGTINGNLNRAELTKLYSVKISDASSTFNMYGGTIVGGANTGNGGNVYITTGNFDMHGGTITGGASEKKGGNVCIAGAGIFTMTGGTISDGIAGTSGGNVSINSGGTFRMEGGTVSGGTAKNGAAIHAYKSTVEITGGTVSSGTVTENAPCIYWESGTVTAGPNAQVDDIYKKP